MKILNQRLSTAIIGLLGFFAPTLAAADVAKAVRFQGQTWTGNHLKELRATTHLGKEALLVRPDGFDEVALISGVDFNVGTIELELATEGRSNPTLAVNFVKARNSYDRIVFSPSQLIDGESKARLRQGVVTPGDPTSVVVSFFASNRTEYNRNQWFHVRVEIGDQICLLYIDHDETPAMAFLNTFRSGGGIGLANDSCLVRNVKITPADS